MGRHVHYSDAELAFLSEHAAMPRRELTRAFNDRFDREISLENIKAKCTRMGLKTGRTGCFKPGNIPHPDAGPKGPNRTSFKKGHVTHNKNPLHHVRLTDDGTYEIKVFETGASKKDYVPCHHLVWMLHKGPIPENHVVTFVDGDHSNIEPENLRCIHRGANAIINKLGLRDRNSDLSATGINLGVMRHMIYQKSRQVSA